MILFIIPSIYGGGAERVVTRMANFWVENGQKVAILTLDKDTEHYPLDSRVQLIRAGIYKPSAHKIEAVWNNIQRIRILRGYFRDLKPSAVISFTEDTNVLTCLSALGNRSFRLIISDRLHPAAFASGKIWGFIKKIAYGFADNLVVQTQSVLPAYKDYRVPISVIYNPLPSPPVSIQSYDNQRIIAVGRLTHQKNFDLLIRAFAQVRAPNWQVHIIGEGEDYDQLTALIAEKGLQGCIILRGRSNHVYEELKAASVFVLSSRAEGFPNALIEAMSVGLACISTDCPSGPSEIIESGENGFLIRQEDESELVVALQNLTENKELRSHLGQNAIKILNKTDENNIMRQWMSLLE